MLRRKRPGSNHNGRRAQACPVNQRRDCGRPKVAAPREKDSDEQRESYDSEEKLQRVLRGAFRGWWNLPAEQNAACERDGKSYGRDFHVTLRRFTSVSM